MLIHFIRGRPEITKLYLEIFKPTYLPTPPPPQSNLNFHKTFIPHLNLNFFTKNAKPIKHIFWEIWQIVQLNNTKDNY